MESYIVLPFRFAFFLLNIIPWRFAQVLCTYSLFLFIMECVFIYHNLFHHLFAEGHLSCLKIFISMTQVAMNIYILLFMFSIFCTYKYMIAGLYGNCVFSFIGDCQVFS